MNINQKDFLNILEEHNRLDFQKQIDYNKYYLYSIITHSTAIEGSTMTEVDNQLLFDEGLTAKGKNIIEHNMNLDLKAAYERSMELAEGHTPVSIGILKQLAALVMRRTGGEINGLNGSFDSSKGDLRLVNVTAGAGGKTYMNFQKVPHKMEDLCREVNERRKELLESPDIYEQYKLSFIAHLKLVTIHPWVDGNGRMARLIMNHLQHEFGLLQSKVLKENRNDYIKALKASQEEENEVPFLEFMFEEHARNLQKEIENYKLSIGNDEVIQPQRHFRR